MATTYDRALSLIKQIEAASKPGSVTNVMEAEIFGFLLESLKVIKDWYDQYGKNAQYLSGFTLGKPSDSSITATTTRTNLGTGKSENSTSGFLNAADRDKAGLMTAAHVNALYNVITKADCAGIFNVNTVTDYDYPFASFSDIPLDLYYDEYADYGVMMSVLMKDGDSEPKWKLFRWKMTEELSEEFEAEGDYDEKEYWVAEEFWEEVGASEGSGLTPDQEGLVEELLKAKKILLDIVVLSNAAEGMTTQVTYLDLSQMAIVESSGLIFPLATNATCGFMSGVQAKDLETLTKWYKEEKKELEDRVKKLEELLELKEDGKSILDNAIFGIAVEGK